MPQPANMPLGDRRHLLIRLDAAVSWRYD